jgi:hypothetical protein
MLQRLTARNSHGCYVDSYEGQSLSRLSTKVKEKIENWGCIQASRMWGKCVRDVAP